ncbi:ATP-binding protein [Ideonella sp. 4Y11]|uniref:ATP-binding protein n=1 Tax=Ideonella aquatica TaxID=2824119 RepID=A0A941BJS6_9BURK|nr:ATP-binding protein [Ideonella aquatica]MBQ0957809.1 ATP-binding protein [Ideonella aquatica]
MTTDDTNAGQAAPAKKIHTDPTKDFFVTMITRDIQLRDCIFDLLDNSIDGARRKPSDDDTKPFIGYEIRLAFDENYFRIEDNTGGIRLSDAIDYAFHFGRRADSPEVPGGIGLYGIGMKRAIFKIGRICSVTSHADDASFRVNINVEEWKAQDAWDFDYEDIEKSETHGTQIQITAVNDGVKEMLGDPVFRNELMKAIARDYAFFIQQGLKISVGDDIVPSYTYQLRQSEDLMPSVDQYEDNGVHVRILAGLVDELPDDIPDELKPGKVDRYGWFVICNDRVVLAADKTEATIWGDDKFNLWHPQYNGFAGFVFYNADDQRRLPWTTTKRELDPASPLYRRTITRMKAVTQVFTDYTNRRKADIETAKAAETPRAQVDISQLKIAQAFKLPTIAAAAAPRPATISIQYSRDKREVEEIKRHLGNIGMSARDVGIKTFEYFREVELGK